MIAGAVAVGATEPTSASPAQVIWVTIDSKVKLNKVEKGTTLVGKLARAVYWRELEIFPKGSTVRMVVDEVESRKKTFGVDDRPFVIHLFAPRHELVARFRSVIVFLADGSEVPLYATFIAMNQRAQLSTPTFTSAFRSKKDETDFSHQATREKKSRSPWILTLTAEPEGTSFPAIAAARNGSQSSAASTCPVPCGLENGARIRVALLDGISASRNRQGQAFRSVLLEPVMVGPAVAIPQGSILQGVLAKRVPPRRLYRPGALSLTFNRLTQPNGATTIISASPVAAEVDRGTHMKMDSEGTIHAQTPGTARFLLDFAVTGGISKVSDDTAQLIVEAISSTATDASTAGVAKIAALSATAIYMLTRHGRDVILPPYTEMEVILNRAVPLTANPPEALPPR
jgi:hypothetical protein